FVRTSPPLSPVRTGDGRAWRSRRCALPITALRLTPPRVSAIWLAVMPCSHNDLSCAIRSSVHDILTSLQGGARGRLGLVEFDRRLRRSRERRAGRVHLGGGRSGLAARCQGGLLLLAAG